MDDFFKTLWTSFVTETSSVTSDIEFTLKKNDISTVDIQVIFRQFHNMKSNARLLEYRHLSDASELGEEICREIINNNVAISDEVIECLRVVYRHASYLFEFIKTNKSEPVDLESWSTGAHAPGLDRDAIRNFIYGEFSADPAEKYARRELETFSRIMAAHFTYSLALSENADRAAVQKSIITIKESAELLEFSGLSKLYDELYRLWCDRISLSDPSWHATADRIMEAVSQIEKDNNFDFSLQQMRRI